MSEGKYKTMRHMETVRNYLHMVVREFLDRAERHDQSKLRHPEAEYLEKHTNKLRGVEYGSPEYHACIEEMRQGVDHHYALNRHHPEHFGADGINGMNLFDLLEMICDWKAASLRHDTGDIRRSLEINRDRYKIDPQLERILRNTIEEIESQKVHHYAKES